MLNFLTVLLRKFPFFTPSPARQYSHSSPNRARSLPRAAEILANIDLRRLREQGISGIILDLDNTVVSEDDRYLSPYAEDWIAEAKEMGLQFFILSNGKRRYRVDYWSARLAIPALSPAKKPFPKAFRRALKTMQLSPQQVVVIGDSRHTDVMGAWLIGAACIQVASLPHPPRWWEKVLGKYVQTPYSLEQKLWDFHPSHYAKHS